MKPTQLIEIQGQFDQAAALIERLDVALDRQRAALAAISSNDAELAALKRQRQQLLVEKQIADDPERVARDLAALDRKLAKEKATADEIGDTVQGLESERERLAGELVDIRRRLADERHNHIVEALGKPAISNYLEAAGVLFTALIEIRALEQVDVRLHGRLKYHDPEGARERNPAQLLWTLPAELPRPPRWFIEGKDLAPLPADRPHDNYLQTLWGDSELDRCVADRERALLDELRQQGITVD